MEENYVDRQLNNSIARFKEISIKKNNFLIRTNFMLTIVEDATSMAQTVNSNYGDIIC